MNFLNKKQFIYPIALIILVFFLWEGTVLILDIPEYLIPKPSAIFIQLYRKFQILLPHLYITAIESILGFLLGSLLGIILAVAFTYSKTLEQSFYPYTIALKSIPIVAIAPLLIVWFGNGIAPKIIVSAIITFFPVVVNMTKGLNRIDKDAFDIFNSLSATKLQVFLKLRLINSLPYLFAALKMSATLSVTGAIVGEFSGSDKGLGFFILISSHRLETVDMFVGIILSSLLGILLFYFIVILEKFFIPWEKDINI
ncbi:ABC transporter permease [Culturomica massiliensis]|uniref:ABC transporter permease n=1 Tax=Culturomica massiliensis TaxID=1841857 RepID=UPI00266687C1|nr:ABC transporter permease [Culturomica massiliensis]